MSRIMFPEKYDASQGTGSDGSVWHSDSYFAL